MKLDHAITSREANASVLMTTEQIGDLYDIDWRIKNGDESGWKGDPSMGVFFNQITHRYEVWGIDRGGRDYIAASHDRLDHTLLLKLREGDWSRGDPFQKVLEHNAKLEADRDAAEKDALAGVVDKMAWAVRRLAGATKTMHAVSESHGTKEATP